MYDLQELVPLVNALSECHDELPDKVKDVLDQLAEDPVFACVVDGSCSEPCPECSIDEGELDSCDFAQRYKCKEDCPHWCKLTFYHRFFIDWD